MKAKNLHFRTLKESPNEAEVPSHNLMIRSGMIRKLSSGIYIYMPLGLKVLKNIEGIIREEMDKIGGHEVVTPLVQPADLWKITNRWESMGQELLRFKDRNNRDFVLQPTSEEVFVEIARSEIKSWKQLPKIFYQIQTKFRDERRPRFGLLRAREFVMKDAYSFDTDTSKAEETYNLVFSSYRNILRKLELEFKPVIADTGEIGGSKSHEFHVLADTGEDELVFNPKSDFAMNIELAAVTQEKEKREKPSQSMSEIRTPNLMTCEEVAKFLAVPIMSIVKSLVIVVGGNTNEDQTNFYLILIRGDHRLNEVKLTKLFKGATWRFATKNEINNQLESVAGFVGPVSINSRVRLIADLSVINMSDFIVGANILDKHLGGINWGRDLREPDIVADVRFIKDGEFSAEAGGRVMIKRGIEVGHTFFLGSKYSKAFDASYLDSAGVKQYFEMGCYGIGLSRLAGAIIEQHHDTKGIIWPKNVAPFTLVICPIDFEKNADVKSISEQLYRELKRRDIRLLLDDRGERTGRMFIDWELVGIPFRLTFSPRLLTEKKVEIFVRSSDEKFKINIGNMVEEILKIIKN